MTDGRIVWTVAKWALTAGAVAVLLAQCRKPRWWLGHLVVRGMNRSHLALTNWGLGHVAIGERFTILDVGCGGGRTIQTFAEIASGGKVFGVDYSATSVSAARRTNAAAIAAGRVDVRQASVSALPFPDDTFDLVSAIETHYYWPAPADDMREIRRVLKPGGRLVVIAEAYKPDAGGTVMTIPMTLLRAHFLTVREHRELLAAAGFTDVVIHEERKRGWLCAVGQKPSP